MEWQPRFALGIPHIDDQHRELIGRVNALSEALNTHRMYEQLGQSLKFVVDYTRFHFETEEAFLEQHAYAHLARHKQMHAELTGRVTRVLNQLKQGKPLLPSQFIAFLTDWVITHILNEDKRYGLYIERKATHPDESARRLFEEKSRNTRTSLAALCSAHGDKRIDEVLFAREKARLLETFIQVDPSFSRKQVKQLMAQLELFDQETLITPQESIQFRSRLFKAHLLELELERRKRPETRLNFLAAALDGGLLGQEEFEALTRPVNGANGLQAAAAPEGQTAHE